MAVSIDVPYRLCRLSGVPQFRHYDPKVTVFFLMITPLLVMNYDCNYYVLLQYYLYILVLDNVLFIRTYRALITDIKLIIEH